MADYRNDIVAGLAFGLGSGLAVGTLLHQILPFAILGAALGLLYGLRRSKAANILAGLVAFALILLITFREPRDTFDRAFLREMRSGLREVAASEDTYYSKHQKYTSDLAALDSASLYLGRARVVVDRADAHQWRATASHDFITNTCTISGTRAGGSGVAKVEGPTCTMGEYTAAWRNYRGSFRTHPRAREPVMPAWDHSVPSIPSACVYGSLAEGGNALRPLKEPEDFGYPVKTVDRLAVRKLLLDRSYNALDNLLSAYADSARRDFRLEYRMFEAYDAFDVALEPLEPFLGEWVQKHPGSGNALLARATYYTASGWHARGTEYMDQTSSGQLIQMSTYFQRARSDIDAGLHVLPCSVVAYHLLMLIAPAAGDTGMSQKAMVQALLIQPYSFLIRARHMYNLRPRWGGSYEAMARLPQESDSLAHTNPRLRALHGFAAWDSADFFERRNDTAQVLQAYARALSFGDFWQFRLDRGAFYYRIDRNREALADLERARVQHPQEAELLDYLASAKYELGRTAFGPEKTRLFSEVFRDEQLAERLDPVNQDVRESMAFYLKNIPQYAPRAP